jgi:hemerythrin
MVEKLTWSKKLSVYNREIDEQHKTFFFIINDLINARRDSANEAAVLTILSRMLAYAGYHFVTEEAYMIENDYPFFQSHVKEHQSYNLKLKKLIDEYKNDPTKLSTDMLWFLRNWWIDHINTSDMHFAKFIARKTHIK